MARDQATVRALARSGSCHGLLDLLVLLGLATTCLVYYHTLVPKDAYAFDAADYVTAAGMGFYANYTDRNAIPLSKYIEMGIEKGLVEKDRAGLSNFIRQSQDVAFFRHYHGPLYFYLLMVANNVTAGDEHDTRGVMLILLFLSAAGAYASCVLLDQERSRLGAVIAAGMLISSPSNVATAISITPHSAYVVTSLAVLFFMARSSRDPRQRLSTGAAIAMAFSFATIEYALILLATFVICTYARPNLFREASPATHLKRLSRWVGVLLLTLLALWPGAFLQLTIVRNYLFHAYYAIVRGAEYGTQSFLEVWLQRLGESPVEYGIIAVSLVIYASLKNRPAAGPYLVYSLLILMTTLRNTSGTANYISSLLPPLYVASGLALAEFMRSRSERLRIAVVVSALSALIFWNLFNSLPEARTRVASMTYTEMMDFIEANSLGERDVVVDRLLLPTLRLYFPQRRYLSFSGTPDGFLSLASRQDLSNFQGTLYIASRPGLEALFTQIYSASPVPVTDDKTIAYCEFEGGTP